MLTIRQLQDKKEWEEFVTCTTQYTPFFQSWNWGLVQEAMGNKCFRLGVYEKEKLIGVCLAVLVAAKRGRYLHLRHGPLLTDFSSQFDAFLEYLKSFIDPFRIDFIRMSPHLQTSEEMDLFFAKRGFRNAAIHNMDAENAWLLDLDKSEDDLLSGMRKTTRYLVRKAESMPVDVVKTNSEKDFGEFMKLYKQTSLRHGFVPHRGIEEEFRFFAKDGLVNLYLAKYKGKIIAGAMVVFYGKQAVYHHGASSDLHKEIPAAHLLQWRAILDAKKQGKSVYNFWGVVPPEKPNHPWQGLTMFKTGFGGRRVDFVHAKDLPLGLKYWKTYLIESAWRIKRGY